MRWHIAFTNLIEQELLGNNIENELHFSVIYRCPIHGQFGVTMYREGGGGEEGVSEGTRNNIDVLFQNIAIYLSGHVSFILSRNLAYPNWCRILKFQSNDSSGLFKQFAGLYFSCSSYSGTSRFSFKRWT